MICTSIRSVGRFLCGRSESPINRLEQERYKIAGYEDDGVGFGPPHGVLDTLYGDDVTYMAAERKAGAVVK